MMLDPDKQIVRMNLLYTDVEDHLRASVRDLLGDRCGADQVLARTETEQPLDAPLWQTLAASLGATSLHVPEELGGQGATVRETAVVLEELGRSVAPVPFLGSAVLATTALLGCSHEEQVTSVLELLAKGESTATLAMPLSSMVGSAFPDSVRANGSGLTGTVTSVADAGLADLLVVPAMGADGPQLHAVKASAATVTPVLSLDLTRPVSDLTFDGSESTLLASGDVAASAVDGALLAGAALLASEQLGIAEWCLNATVDYLKGRTQFGRPLGSFQALKHRLADLWQEIVLARAVARYAADTLATGDADAPVAASLAQSLCASVAVHAAEEAVQLHGGIGMTWEHPAHLYLKRAKADEIALGSPARHRARLAGLVDLPGPTD